MKIGGPVGKFLQEKAKFPTAKLLAVDSRLLFDIAQHLESDRADLAIFRLSEVEKIVDDPYGAVIYNDFMDNGGSREAALEVIPVQAQLKEQYTVRDGYTAHYSLYEDRYSGMEFTFREHHHCGDTDYRTQFTVWAQNLDDSRTDEEKFEDWWGSL